MEIKLTNQKSRKIGCFGIFDFFGIGFFGFGELVFVSDFFGFGVLVSHESCMFRLLLFCIIFGNGCLFISFYEPCLLGLEFCCTPPVHTMGSYAADQKNQYSTLTFVEACAHVPGQIWS